MIKLVQVSRRFVTVQAVLQVSLEIGNHEVTGLVGPSGSGKTTLLRLIAGLEIPDEGEIYFNDRLVSRPGWVMGPHLRKLGFVFQSPALWPHLNVTQNIAFGLKDLAADVARERINATLEWSGLKPLAKRYPAQLSGGEARRVSLARAIAPSPDCLLMDEPLIFLDPGLKNEILTVLKEYHRQTGASMVYVTHDEQEARQICERMLRLEVGELVGDDKTGVQKAA